VCGGVAGRAAALPRGQRLRRFRHRKATADELEAFATRAYAEAEEAAAARFSGSTEAVTAPTLLCGGGGCGGCGGSESVLGLLVASGRAAEATHAALVAAWGESPAAQRVLHARVLGALGGNLGAAGRSAGLSAADAKAAGFSGLELQPLGFTVQAYFDAGFSAAELLAAGHAPADLAGAAGDLQQAGRLGGGARRERVRDQPWQQRGGSRGRGRCGDDAAGNLQRPA
jgi:hypothetical protein